jgi:hypothetical protein
MSGADQWGMHAVHADNLPAGEDWANSTYDLGTMRLGSLSPSDLLFDPNGNGNRDTDGSDPEPRNNPDVTLEDALFGGSASPEPARRGYSAGASQPRSQSLGQSPVRDTSTYRNSTQIKHAAAVRVQARFRVHMCRKQLSRRRRNASNLKVAAAKRLRNSQNALHPPSPTPAALGATPTKAAGFGSALKDSMHAQEPPAHMPERGSRSLPGGGGGGGDGDGDGGGMGVGMGMGMGMGIGMGMGMGMGRERGAGTRASTRAPPAVATAGSCPASEAPPL